jgi:hypothetical protein
VLRPDELADLAAYDGDLSLDHEIACARVALRRVLTLLNVPLFAGGARIEDGPDTADLSAGDIRMSPGDIHMSPSDYARLAGLALQAIRTVAKLMRDRRALLGDTADGFAGAIAQALDELSTEWGVRL